MATSAVQRKRVGFDYWMQEVLVQWEQAAAGLASDPVHDLRTALRRCRSMADGIRVFDPDLAWKRMKKAGRQLFRSLGALRDTHVIAEWLGKLAPEDDVTRKQFAQFLENREKELKEIAFRALEQFDRKQWGEWARELPARAERVPPNSQIFAQLALERWHEARALHRRAMRNRTKVAFHELRIGIKRLRYTIENFLPALDAACGRDLKELQDALGDVHDLDVLWHAALALKVFPDSVKRMEWRAHVEGERQQRLEQYRSKMIGPASLWPVWRDHLPQPGELRAIGFQRLKIWGSFLDPSITHSKHVQNLALQIFDGFPFPGARRGNPESHRHILQAAALLHDVGHARTRKGHHKASARLIRQLAPPLGWTANELRISALVARYHRGALPRETQKTFSALPKSDRWLVQFLGGILRLACACDRQHDHQIRRIQVESWEPVLTVRAEGYAEATPLAEHLAAARHLLELACRRPVFVLPLNGQPHAA
jgi:CHAD domain-containing protein